MSDLPTTDELRRAWIAQQEEAHGHTPASLPDPDPATDFDAWLAQERAEAQQAVRAELAAQYTARAAQARSTSAAFVWQQAARTAGGEDQ